MLPQRVEPALLHIEGLLVTSKLPTDEISRSDLHTQRLIYK
jgi:hypothetical protein